MALSKFKKNKILIPIIIVLTIVLLVIMFKVFNIYDMILKKIYPIKYMNYVEKYSEEFGQDKYLILAIIKAESNFDENAVSNKGATGLMQIMNATGEEVAKKLSIEYEENKTLYDPEINIKIGIKYFADLNESYEDVSLALAAYNAGTGNVQKWIGNGIIKENGEDIENIPIQETNNYVRKILRDYEIYKELYVKS